jgi:hypothetical protein
LIYLTFNWFAKVPIDVIYAAICKGFGSISSKIRLRWSPKFGQVVKVRFCS